MITGGKGGGNTRSGIIFENRVDILHRFKEIRGYEVEHNQIFYNKKEVAKYFKKRSLYRFLESKNINYKDYISKRLEPDNGLFVLKNNTMYIIEMKFQKTAGSVDEKLQTCDFKKKQYSKLMSSINYNVEYIYLLNDWFKKPEYKDVLEYIKSVDCRYYFNILPLEELGLPN